MARNATLADVAATLIGNAASVESPRVVKVLAKDLYPSTDIPDLWVTQSIGDLDSLEIEQAIQRGLDQADRFQHRSLILGAFVAVKNRYRMSESLTPFI